jgi:hypothetical protein
LPPHAPDILAVRIQAIDGARTCTLLDSQHCRLLPSQIVPTAAGSPAGQPRLLHPSRTCIVAFARIGPAIRPTTGNWRSEDFHLARLAALSAAHERTRVLPVGAGRELQSNLIRQKFTKWSSLGPSPRWCVLLIFQGALPCRLLEAIRARRVRRWPFWHVPAGTLG